MELFDFQPAFVQDLEFLEELKNFLDDQEVFVYNHRGKPLKSRPKLEFRLKEDLFYRWGQHKTDYLLGFNEFPEILIRLKNIIGDESINHIIVTKYTTGNNHIPWHQDKQEGVSGAGAKDIVAGTKIYNLIICDNPRRFQLAEPSKIGKKGECSEFVFDELLDNGSLLTLTAEGNKQLLHRVPKEKHWNGIRYSIVFRTVKEETQTRKRKRE